MENFYDVLIIGGGPAGTVAAIASARQGAKTILIEQHAYLGGAMTAAGTGPQMTFHAGEKQVVLGIPEEMTREMVRRGFCTGHVPDGVGFCSSTTAFDPEGMKVVWEDMAMESGVTLLYHAMFTGCEVENGSITSAQIFTKGGFYQLNAKVFIDASADADVAHYAGVPVWNGLTNEFHPTQILADFLTIREHFGELKGKKLVYMGDARFNMGNSLMVGCAKMGMDFVACAPKAYFPHAELTAQCQAIAAETGAVLEFIEDPLTATKDAHVLYTDVWVSMGEPDAVWQERIEQLSPYRITKELMDNAGEQAVFMHCLPAFHDLKTTVGKQIYDKFGIDCMEVTDQVFESDRSIVFDEAENRMHTIKAVMAATLAVE